MNKRTKIGIFKADNRGRVTLPPHFRSEPLFEYVIEGDAITRYPVRKVRKYQDISDLPVEELSQEWAKREDGVNKDKGPGISAASPAKALKALRR